MISVAIQVVPRLVTYIRSHREFSIFLEAQRLSHALIVCPSAFNV